MRLDTKVWHTVLAEYQAVDGIRIGSLSTQGMEHNKHCEDYGSLTQGERYTVATDLGVVTNKSRMTPSGKQLFMNASCLINAFGVSGRKWRMYRQHERGR